MVFKRKLYKTVLIDPPFDIQQKGTYGDLTGNRTRIARMKTWCPNR